MIRRRCEICPVFWRWSLRSIFTTPCRSSGFRITRDTHLAAVKGSAEAGFESWGTMLGQKFSASEWLLVRCGCLLNSGLNTGSSVATWPVTMICLQCSVISSWRSSQRFWGAGRAAKVKGYSTRRHRDIFNKETLQWLRRGRIAHISFWHL